MSKLVNLATLSRSLSERDRYRHTVIPKCVAILGVEDVARFTIVELERQARSKEALGHADAARLIRQAIGIYKVTARRLSRVTREAMSLAFCGDEQKMRQMRWST